MVAVLILVALIVLVLLISFCTFRTAFYAPPGKHPTADNPMKGAQYRAVADDIRRISHIMEKIPCEDIIIRSFDGTRLHGRYYHVKDGAPLEILCHGYRSCAFRDCSGGHALSRKMGFNALVIDQRAHGESGGRVITFGVLERQDLLCWISYANQRFSRNIPIVLCGLSMGAATVLMAAELDLPENVAAMIADSPYSTPSAIIEKVCADRRYPVFLCRPFLRLGASVFGRFNLNACSAKDAVRHAKVPILLIHGEDDHFVPCEMSREIAANCASRVVVQTFPGAGHGLSYLVDPQRYERVVFDFLRGVPQVSCAISGEFAEKIRQIGKNET